MICDNEVVSENATRSIFGWLRFDSYAPHEKPKWDLEWLAISDSDEDEDRNGYETASNNGTASTPYVRSWISSKPVERRRASSRLVNSHHRYGRISRHIEE